MIQSTADNTLGAILIGVITAAVLYGITTMQCLTYHSRSAKDSIYLKIVVFILWLLSTIHQVLITQVLYVFAVSGFDNMGQLNSWSMIAHVPIVGTADFIIRCIFCTTIWKLSNQKWCFVLPVFLGNLFSLAGNIALFIEFILANQEDAPSNFSLVLTCALGGSVIADVLLASSVFMILRSRRTGFKNTDCVIRSIIWYGISIALLTTFFSTLCLIMYKTMPDTLAYMSVYCVVPDLMMNALLTGYNSRAHLRKSIANAGEPVTIHFHTISGFELDLENSAGQS